MASCLNGFLPACLCVCVCVRVCGGDFKSLSIWMYDSRPSEAGGIVLFVCRDKQEVLSAAVS